jgi:hypothetical protein
MVLNNVPSSSRNTIVQAEANGMDIEDQFNPMEEDDTNNIVELNDGINILVDDIFSPIVRTNLMIFMIYLCLRRHNNPFMKDKEQILSLL